MDIHECRRWLLKNVNFYGLTKNTVEKKKNKRGGKRVPTNLNSLSLEELQRQSKERHKGKSREFYIFGR